MEATVVLSTESQAITNYDYSKLFLTNFDTVDGNVAASGADIELVVGQLIGRISATGKLAVLASASTDGSQYPLGVCLRDYSITDGEDADIVIATTGKVDSSKLVFDGTDTLETVVDGRQLGDLIPAATGLKLVSINQLAELDNQ